jgi:hypothetical protein
MQRAEVHICARRVFLGRMSWTGFASIRSHVKLTRAHDIDGLVAKRTAPFATVWDAD